MQQMNPVWRARNNLREFHGWRVSLAGSVIWALQSLVWSQGYGNIAVVLENQFGWSKTFLAFGASLRSAEAAILGVPLGLALKRYNIGHIMKAGAVAQTVGFLILSQVQNKAGFITAIVVITIGATLAGFLTITATVVGWFERKRARALSFSSMGFAIGGVCAPVMVWGFRLIGWRWTVAIAGVILGIFVWRLAGTMAVRREETGEPVDGVNPTEVSEAPRAEGVQDAHFTTSEAVRTHSFWMIALGHGAALLVVSSVLTLLPLYLTEDRGFSAGRAALIAGFVPLFQLEACGNVHRKEFLQQQFERIRHTHVMHSFIRVADAAEWFFLTQQGLLCGGFGQQPALAAHRCDEWVRLLKQAFG